DLVGNTPVDLVPDSGEHGYCSIGDRARDHFAVERREIAACSTTAHDDDHIERVLRQTPDPVRDATVGGTTLHANVGQPHTKGVPARLQLVHEVAVPRARTAGHEAHGQRHVGKHTVGIGPEQTLGRQLAQYSVAIGREASDGEDGVDPVHDQLQAAG